MKYQPKHIVIVSLILASLLVGNKSALAQDAGPKKTIDITSSFKPSLRPSEKLRFSPSPAQLDTARPALKYDIPAQNLAVKFYPSSLRPLAFEQDSLPQHQNSVYLKLGYGNFKTPYGRALATFGDGVKSSGSVEADYVGSKGKLPLQEYAQYGARVNAWLNAGENNTFRIHGGYRGWNSYKYGYEPKDKEVAADSMKVAFSLAEFGMGLSNKQAGETGVFYDGSLSGHYFADREDGKETALNFNLPFEKAIGEQAVLQVGIKGMVSKITGKDDLAYNNNLFMIPVGARLNLSEGFTLRAGAIPSWNNNAFKMLPDVEAEYLLNENNLVLQGGWRGYFTPQTYRSLATMNPWIMMPDTLTNTRHNEIYAGVKSVVNEHLSYRVKVGVGKLHDLPLFVNAGDDGRHFQVLREAKANVVSVAGEVIYQQGEKFYWSNGLTANSYSQLQEYDKAYGLMPFEFRSSARYLIMKGLRLKADLYMFSGAFYQEKSGDSQRGEGAMDLNAGLEFDLKPRVAFWLQFNNIINMDYERWNQYRTLGFQALGGVIVRL